MNPDCLLTTHHRERSQAAWFPVFISVLFPAACRGPLVGMALDGSSSLMKLDVLSNTGNKQEPPRAVVAPTSHYAEAYNNGPKEQPLQEQSWVLENHTSALIEINYPCYP